MADPKQVSAGNGVGNIADLLGLLGGQKSTTTTTGNTGVLNQVVGQLQANDPTALLQSIFQQAGGAIPGLQAARSNAVGARTGNNSVAATAMDKLMQDTVLKAQQQIAQQQLAAQQLQVQAGSAIAGADRTQQTKSGTNLDRATGVLGLLSAGNKLAGSDLGKTAVAKGKGLFDSITGGGVDAAAPVVSSGGPSFDLGSAPTIGDSVANSGVGDYSSLFADNPFSSFGGGGGSFAPLSDAGSAAGTIFDTGGVADNVPDLSEFGDLFGFKDGGLVGRDNKKPEKEKETKKGYADGGSVNVKSPGGRQGSGGSYNPLAPVQSQAVQSPGNILNPKMFADTLGVPNPDEVGSGAANNAGQSSMGMTMGNVANAIGMAAMTAMNPAMAVAMAIDNAVQTQNPDATPGLATTGLSIATANPIGALKGLIGLLGTPDAADTGFNMGTTSVGDSAAPGLGGVGGLAEGLGQGGGFADSSGFSGDGGFGGSVGVGSSADNPGSVGEGDGGSTGGPVKGKGTGTSDSVKGVSLSDGEYVIPADVVQKLGVTFFDQLRQHFHEPVDSRWGPGSPEDSDSKNGVDDAGE